MRSEHGLRRLGLLCGALFAAGLWLSGMTDPGRVLAFLDVTGSWDPSLLFVMGAAVAVFGVAHHLGPGRTGRTITGGALPSLPVRIDSGLVIGAALFGVGWGLSGLCPGPSVVKSSHSLGAVVTLGGTLLGMAAVRWAKRRSPGLPPGSAARFFGSPQG